MCNKLNCSLNSDLSLPFSESVRKNAAYRWHRQLPGFNFCFLNDFSLLPKRFWFVNGASSQRTGAILWETEAVPRVHSLEWFRSRKLPKKFTKRAHFIFHLILRCFCAPISDFHIFCTVPRLRRIRPGRPHMGPTWER